jgi:exopolysaccharide biosynthesis polyprenyl glycosylphosphotransferase
MVLGREQVDRPMSSSRQAGTGAHPSGLIASMVILDLISIAVAMGLAYLGRSRLSVFPDTGDVDQMVLPVVQFLPLGWILLLMVVGAYSPRSFGVGTFEFRRVLNASLVTAGGVGIACYLARYSLSRGFFVLTFVLGITLLILGRLMLRRMVQRARRSGKLTLRAIIVGPERSVTEVAQVLQRESWLGYRVVGAVTPLGDEVELSSGLPVVGHVNDVLDAVQRTHADTVVFTSAGFASANDLRRVAWELESHNAQMIVVPSISDVSRGRVHMRPVGGLPLVYVERPQSEAASTWLKRAFDILGALAVLLVVSPVLAITALLIKREDGGPVLFRQERVGRDGKTFECLKFRSMVVDAEARLQALQAQNMGDGVLFKMTDDPRITRIGKVIRRFSIDEFPQLVNVLRGEMSLVGPRPSLPSEVERYHSDVMRRLRVRPGLTGLWQVSGRSDLSWDDAVRLDLYYVDNWSMMQDLHILVRTVRAVAAARGAY